MTAFQYHAVGLIALWLAVILCHGLYDTIAFIRFANKTSKYSKFEDAG